MPVAADQPKDRRQSSVVSYSFAPEPKRLRSMLAEIEERLSALGDSSELQRNVLVLVGEIASRLLRSSMEVDVLHLDLEIKRGTVRVDIWQEIVDQPCALLGLVDDPVLRDLAWASGNDRRRPCGAWFEFVTSAGAQPTLVP
jgi:hypothetical protein